MNPDLHTRQELFIEVGDSQQLYVQEWGNVNAQHTTLFLHGGPGSGTSDSHKKRFDPGQHHVIFFDQRGCGRSLPYGTLENNTTDKLVEDIAHILDHLKVRTAIIVGGSWGSTLALAFALKHPKKTTALVLQGVFTGSRTEIDWLGQGLFKTFYPDAWAQYLKQTPKSHHHNPTAYHAKRVLGDDQQARLESGYIYETLEGSIINLDDRFRAPDPLDFDPLPIRMELHYMQNTCFMPDQHILSRAGELTMPVWMVQGRYDMVCPPTTAYELDQKLPNSRLLWTLAGHRNADRANDDVLKAILLQFS